MRSTTDGVGEKQTIELNGRAIAVMGGSREQVEEFAEGDGFRADLLSFMDSDGRPLWDGQGIFAPSVRPAMRDEAAAFQLSFTDAAATGEADADDSSDWLVFLIDVHEALEGCPS